MTSRMVLVVDDDDRVRETAREMFTEAGWLVTDCRTPEEATQILLDYHFDVVISDWDFGMYSQIKGGQFLREIYSAGLADGTARFIMSGLTRSVDDGVGFIDKMYIGGIVGVVSAALDTTTSEE